jgi:hypothetical protein
VFSGKIDPNEKPPYITFDIALAFVDKTKKINIKKSLIFDNLF